MKKLPELNGKTVAVFGLGKAGRSAVGWLRASNCYIYAWDDNKESCRQFARDYADKDITVSPPDAYMWGTIDALVLSPGVPLHYPKPHPIVEMARKSSVPVICDIELLYQSAPDAKYVGVTGTNGKSTVTALIGHILAKSGVTAEIGGNIGTPASSLPVLGEEGIYVLEVSSYQLDLLADARFDISVLTNITPDHLDRHGGIEGYVAAKKRIFSHQDNGGNAIISVDDGFCEILFDEIRAESAANIVPISAKQKVRNGIAVFDGNIYDDIDGVVAGSIVPEEVALRENPYLPGEHNRQNIAAAYAVCRMLGVAQEDILDALQSFAGLPHRLQYIGEYGGVRFVNDSKATNAVAVAQALGSYDDIYWIAGGVAKDGGIRDLVRFFPKIRHAFLIGEAQDEFAVALEGKVKYSRCGSLDVAFNRAILAVEKNNMSGKNTGSPVILLSPACASFDQFTDFEHRGETFCRLFEEMKQNCLVREGVGG